MRLCVRQWQGDAWEGEDDGELHLQLPQRSTGGERVDASTPPADRDVRSGAKPDKELEGSCRCCQPEVSNGFVSKNHI